MTSLEEDIKVGCSFFRGHPIHWNGKEWRYTDNGEPIPAQGGEIRPCKKCGKLETLGEGEVDPCLSNLPGVDNACCGHGNPERSYIRFTNGVIVEGFKVSYTEKWKGDKP